MICEICDYETKIKMKLLDKSLIEKLSLQRLRKYHKSLMALLSFNACECCGWGMRNISDHDEEYKNKIKANKKLVMTELYKRRASGAIS